ncbi:MAG: DNA-binding response regulator [Azospira oryzae]|nr:MAG: DNA-binding response regulator [Azospira oryzae]
MPQPATVKLCLVDDHKLFRKGLASLIELVGDNYTILFEADNGVELQKKISKECMPDIVLMDVRMSGMDGFETASWLQSAYPDIKILVVSMIEKEETIVRMLRLGVKGYLCKDVEPHELREALTAVMNKGFYYTDFITGKLLHALHASDEVSKAAAAKELISTREKEFLQLACSEMTYQEIADKMFLSPKTIDGYRNSLFEKLQVKSRVGLVLHAIRHKIVQMDWEV